MVRRGRFVLWSLVNAGVVALSSFLPPFCTRCTALGLRDLARGRTRRPVERSRAAEHQPIELPGFSLVHLRHQMPVAVERRLDRGVAELGLDVLRLSPRGAPRRIPPEHRTEQHRAHGLLRRREHPVARLHDRPPSRRRISVGSVSPRCPPAGARRTASGGRPDSPIGGVLEHLLDEGDGLEYLVPVAAHDPAESLPTYYYAAGATDTRASLSVILGPLPYREGAPLHCGYSLLRDASGGRSVVILITG